MLTLQVWININIAYKSSFGLGNAYAYFDFCIILKDSYCNDMWVKAEVNLYSEQWFSLKAHTGRNPAILDCFD